MGPGEGASFDLTLKNATHPSAPVVVDRVVIQEDQSGGEVIDTYTVEALNAQGAWVNVTTGVSVGNKRIDIFPSPIAATQLRLSLGAHCSGPGCSIKLKRFAAYPPGNCV